MRKKRITVPVPCFLCKKKLVSTYKTKFGLEGWCVRHGVVIIDNSEYTIKDDIYTYTGE